jgi:hypothetical protein
MRESLPDCPACTLHIILATAPQRQEALFDSKVREGFFERYRTNAGGYYKHSDTPYGSLEDDPTVSVLYNPLQYHLFGNYDIVYISLIDNFKFAQKLFEPPLYVPPSDETLFYPHSFQSFTGITHAPEQELKQFFYDNLKAQAPRRPYFLGICNCKLNNGLLIGNGASYLSAVLEQVKNTLDGMNKEAGSRTDFLILQTFSWFELSILLFTDDPENLPAVMRALRQLTFGDLANRDALLSGSLYRGLFSQEPDTQFDAINIFSDTHTYIGLHSDLVKLRKEDAWVQDFCDKKIDFKTAIEWQVKPGHMHLLAPELEELFKLSYADLDINKLFMLPGKNDYTFASNSECINNNLTLMRLLRTDASLFDHVRKFRTQVIFPRDHKYAARPPEKRPIFSFQDKLRDLGVPIRKIQELDSALKALKISRPIRSKILKLFSNFNNGIQDVILFPLFLDFAVFMMELERLILVQSKDTAEKDQTGKALSDLQTTVSGIEEILMRRIAIFQEGYNIRMLNCYQFEDITDFDLDFNTAVQQLLSAYSSLAMAIGSLIYKDDSPYGPIVQLNLKETVANYSAINYYTHHLTSPEFVFATIIKEILNMSMYDSTEYKAILKQYKEVQDHLEKEDPDLSDMIRNKLINIQYLLNDLIRFGITYSLDFDLYYYWFWTYNLQNASLFDKRGIMNEEHFKKELFRILFIAHLFKFDIATKVYCPLQELYSYWDRHFKYLDQHVREYIRYLQEKMMIPAFIDLLTKMMAKELKQVDELVDQPLDHSEITAEKAKHFNCSIEDAPVSEDILDEEFIISYFNRDHIFQELSRGIPYPQLDPYSPLYFQWYMHDYLLQIYRANNKTITFLKRNWEDGKPLLYFIRSEPADNLFLVDPTGGLFFDNGDAIQRYFTMSCKTLHDIWDYSLHIKRDFICKQINSFAHGEKQ